MANYQYMMSAEDIAKELNCSKSHAYKLIKSMNKELVTIAVEHYARKVPLEKLVRERESALKGVALRKRVVELDREMVAELKRLKTELKRVLQKLQDEK